MAKSKRRVEQMKKKRERKKHSMQGGGQSVYALKKKGVYPLNSPYRTIWAHLT